MGKYFGTDGFRGEANITLNVEHAYKVGRYLGWYYGKEHKCKIVIGKDTRRSSYMFEYALVARSYRKRRRRVFVARNDDSLCFVRCKNRGL